MIVYPCFDDAFEDCVNDNFKFYKKVNDDDETAYVVAEEYHHVLHKEMNEFYDPDFGGGFI